MKKHFTFLFTLLVFSAFISKAQVNIIANSDMEEQGAWQVGTLNSHESNSSFYEFAYTEQTADYSEGGALHFTITNTGTDGAHLIFYQEVTLERGKTYMIDMAVKALKEMNNSWFEVYMGTEPMEGEDYGAGQTAMGGFKWSGWEAGCDGLDLFDGTLQEHGCLAGSTDMFSIEGSGDSTLFLAFKAGIWATETEVEFLVDNVTITDIDAVSAIDNAYTNTKLYPNPAKSSFKVQSDNDFSSLKIFTTLGKEVLSLSNFNNTVDVSDLKSGIYLVQLSSINGNSEVLKFHKL